MKPSGSSGLREPAFEEDTRNPTLNIVFTYADPVSPVLSFKQYDGWHTRPWHGDAPLSIYGYPVASSGKYFNPAPRSPASSTVQFPAGGYQTGRAPASRTEPYDGEPVIMGAYKDESGNDNYDITIGDGETHFILMDKKHAGSYLDVGTPYGSDLPFSLEVVETGENYGGGAGSKAIVVRGGYREAGTNQYRDKDYIEYERMKIRKNLKLNVASYKGV